MKLNFKARIRNKTFIISAVALVVSFAYKMLSLFDIVPSVSESEIIEFAGIAINILAFLGVLVDPTTEGINDSIRALKYYKEEYESIGGEVYE